MLGTPFPGRWFMCACLLAGACTNVAQADSTAFTPTKIDPDPPARRPQPSLGSVDTSPSWNLDGIYLWLGPSGAAGYVDTEWDSLIGADVSVLRVRERERLGALGISLGGARWTERGGGRLWVDGLVGTRLGRMVGLSAGPLVELAELSHARVGGSVGAWAFVGVTPFVRVGAIQDLGGFVEVGVHIALPVVRW